MKTLRLIKPLMDHFSFTGVVIGSFAIGLLMHSMTSQAAPVRKPEYKCHFELIGGDQLVRYLPSDAINGASLAHKMKGQFIYAKDGVTKKYIFKVFECVPAKQPFQKKAAQALDSKTLN